MRIDVNVYPLYDKGKVKAMATLMIAGQFVITGIRLMESDQQGYYIKMPSYRSQEYDDFGRAIYKDHAVLNKELYAAVKDDVVHKYEAVMQGYETDAVKAGDLAFPVPDVFVTKLEMIEAGNLCAEASICIGGRAYINGVRILSGKNNNLFVGMPSTKIQKEGGAGTEYKEVCFPVTKDMRTAVNTAVLSDYLARKDQKIRPEDMVVELRNGAGRLFYWHCYTPKDQTQMCQTLYREDYTVVAEAPAHVPMEEFLTLTGTRVNADDFLPVRGSDIINCMKAYHEALIRGKNYGGEMSDTERAAVADTWYFRLADGCYMAAKKTEYPYTGVQVRAVLMNRDLEPIRELTGNGSNITMAAQEVLRKAGLDSSCTAIPTAYFYQQKHRLAVKEEKRWITQPKNTGRTL